MCPGEPTNVSASLDGWAKRSRLMRLRCELHMCPCGFHLNGAQFATRSVSAKHFRFDKAKDRTHMMAAVKLSSKIVLQSKFRCDLKSNDGEIFIQNSPSKSKILCGELLLNCTIALLHYSKLCQLYSLPSQVIRLSGYHFVHKTALLLFNKNNKFGGDLGKNIGRGKTDPEIDYFNSSGALSWKFCHPWFANIGQQMIPLAMVTN